MYSEGYIILLLRTHQDEIVVSEMLGRWLFVRVWFVDKHQAAFAASRRTNVQKRGHSATPHTCLMIRTKLKGFSRAIPTNRGFHEVQANIIYFSRLALQAMDGLGRCAKLLPLELTRHHLDAGGGLVATERGGVNSGIRVCFRPLETQAGQVSGE